MSHTITAKVELKNEDAITTAAQKVEAQILGRGQYALFGNTQTGLGIQLKGWKYPLVVQESGDVQYDNYGGSWGNQDAFDAFMQEYTAEVVRLEAQACGNFVQEETLENGDLKLTINHAG